MDIQRLSQLILGFIDGKEALQLELVTCKNVRKEPLFNKIFQKDQPCFGICFKKNAPYPCIF